MLHYIYGDDLDAFPWLRDTMFLDRAEQFHNRLGWPVKLTGQGFEKDEYDQMNPLYLIWEVEGRHAASMQFMPTVGPTMINDHFSHLTDGVRIESPLIWECTRFCLAPNADRRGAPAIVLGAGEIMEKFHLEHFVGVFDPRMERIYRLLKVVPDVIGSAGTGRDRIGVGLWSFDASARDPICARVGVTPATSREWFARAIAERRPVLAPEELQLMAA